MLIDRKTPEFPHDIRPIIVAEHASDHFGGEAILPLHYFRFLRRRGIESWLVVHERTREELKLTLGADIARVRFVPDHPVQVWCARNAGRSGLVDIVAGLVSASITQRQQRHMVRALIKEMRATVVHQPIPVSPRTPSLMTGVGAPVVIGPMNGGMTYPAGFPGFQSRSNRMLVAVARAISPLSHLLAPGKRRAAALLVANERTRAALPAGSAPHVVVLTENGVDLELFAPPGERPSRAEKPEFVFIGRLVRWKAVDLLLQAVASAVNAAPFTLTIIGDGAERPHLEALVDSLGLREVVHFTGFLAQTECSRRLDRADALVLPSLYESGGAVVLEAMAKSLPVLATRWGGPADYLDDTTGVLVEPRDPQQFITDLREGLIRLATSPELRLRLGRAGRERVARDYDWQRKIDRILEVYRDAQAAAR